MREIVLRRIVPILAMVVWASSAWAGLFSVSDAQVIQAGRQAHNQAMRQYGAWDDPVQQTRIARLGENLARFSTRPEIHYKFYLVNDKALNAFATPDGSIHVTRGLATSFEDDKELSFVLGHEITHVERRHGKQMIEKQIQTQLAGNLLLLALGNKGSLARYGIGGLATWMNMKYSRDFETQADEGGMRLVQKSGLTPEYGPKALEHLFLLSKEKPDLLTTYFGSHPLPADRIQHAKEFARQLESDTTPH